MPQIQESVRDLNSELSRRGQDDGLDLACSKFLFLSEQLNDRQSEGQSLARASEVSRDQILASVDGLEALLLDGEETSDSLLLQVGDGLGSDLWVVGEGTRLTGHGGAVRISLVFEVALLGRWTRQKVSGLIFGKARKPTATVGD